MARKSYSLIDRKKRNANYMPKICRDKKSVVCEFAKRRKTKLLFYINWVWLVAWFKQLCNEPWNLQI